jgi:hypothetical protein
MVSGRIAAMGVQSARLAEVRSLGQTEFPTWPSPPRQLSGGHKAKKPIAHTPDTMATLQVYENSEQRAQNASQPTDGFPEKVLLVMQDGRILVVCIAPLLHGFLRACLTELQGILAGWDQKSNIVLSDCIERRFSMEEGVEETPLGLYLVKGDQM